MEADLIQTVHAAGFEDAEIVRKYDVFEGVPNPSDALQFGRRGSVFERAGRSKGTLGDRM